MTNRERRRSTFSAPIPAMRGVTRLTRNASTRAPLLLILAAFALLASGCARTDRDVYAPGDAGEATFKALMNRVPLWLGGCTAFVQERFAGDRWIDEGGEFVCVWEGFASPVPPKGSRTDDFTARDPGLWRLSYDVGIGCQADQPLSREHCRHLTKVVSNEFTVAALDDDEALCKATGGVWDFGACGHPVCGQPNICRAVIPGCDCGPDANFVDGEGCVEDPLCDRQALCEDTGGVWDPLSCGDYSCGIRPECDAVIPGCNCGPTSVFDDRLGCLAVPCGAPR